jgi:hypothetical protein
MGKACRSMVHRALGVAEDGGSGDRHLPHLVLESRGVMGSGDGRGEIHGLAGIGVRERMPSCVEGACD